jgi:SHS2 domain-containing protein
MDHVGRRARRGHRLLPHAADVIIEAWGGTRVACLEESVRALVETFVETTGAEPTGHVPVSLGADGDEDALVSLLEDVIFAVDALDEVPVTVELVERADGTLEGFLATVPGERLEVVGAVPKGVSRSDLRFGRFGGQWRCRVLVDV